MLTCNKCAREIDGEQYCGDCMADICAERSGLNYRIAALEAQLREREAECERENEGRKKDFELSQAHLYKVSQERTDSLNDALSRAESAEAALAEARAENERLRVEMEQHMQVAASRCSRLLDTEAALEAAREMVEKLKDQVARLGGTL